MQRLSQFVKHLPLALILVAVVAVTVQAFPDLNPKKLFGHADGTPVTTATLDFAREGKRLYVYIHIKQDKDVSNTVKVIWTCPPDSICGNGEYSLNYSGLHYETRAYRTVVLDTQDGDPLVCTGSWKVSLVDKNNKELASGVFVVKDEGVLDQAEAASAQLPADNIEDDINLTEEGPYGSDQSQSAH